MGSLPKLPLPTPLGPLDSLLKTQPQNSASGSTQLRAVQNKTESFQLVVQLTQSKDKVGRGS